MPQVKNKVFVSGCFNMLHSEHFAFLKEASQYGAVYIDIGSDRTIKELKGHDTIYSEEERLFMLNALFCVKDVKINSGGGLLDSLPDLKELRPDIFIVKEEGHSPEKV